MTLLILGLVLWTAAHVYKRLSPGGRAALTDKMGEGSKGVFAVLIIVSVVLMTLGYKAADGPVWWGRNAALVGINNLLMVFAIYLFAASGAKTRITKAIKNPQLTGFKIWCVAHLLVNGDLASFVLFGGLLAWAVWEVILLKRAGVVPELKDDYPTKKEITAVVMTVIVFAVVAGIHIWTGYSPFGA
jgi:uncharacterized membrane protein